MSWSIHPRLVVLTAVPALSLGAATPTEGQQARISEETRTLETYPFSEPNPVPTLARDARLYPYHSFEGYAATPRPLDWKVVTLENDYIEVFVLPEVGGKVWGAVVRETGHEFIYRNEVMKFRNISLRGPWTSGGIEFNFGIIGHAPGTATPVDYKLQENVDGSVSCFVGGMDLPSRTHWRVEIRLPADKAYFETNVVWYNPTPLEQPYYNWMTAAAFARDDLEMAMPGDSYLEHSGRERDWPVDEEGRHLPLYGNNTFGGHKSYHVVGELNDFFGGYYRDDDYGFGHWAPYEDMPGQKLWLWALSREGGVWEDLLTDTDGQYVEFQAGRLFVQYSPGAHVNPITQVGFDPMSASRWSETWFPVEGTGGLTDASRDGVMYVAEDQGLLRVEVGALSAVTDTLRVWAGDRLAVEIPADMAPLGRLSAAVDLQGADRYRVQMAKLGLDYDSDPSARRLERPFATGRESVAVIGDVDRMVFQARERQKGREYGQARDLFTAALDREPWHREALLGLAELDYRSALYDNGLAHVNRVLQIDAYDAEANFLAGTLYRAVAKTADARDALGWASRSTAYRSAAYAQLAQIMIGQRDLAEAERYARLAIDYDRHSIPGWRALAVVARLREDRSSAQEARTELLAIDPLHHFARAEEHLGAPAVATAGSMADHLGGEYPDQTLLELAIGYHNLDLPDDAAAILAALPTGRPAPPVHQAWRAFLFDDPSLLDDPAGPDFAFPYRRESLRVLEWADAQSPDWIWSYLYALNLWAVDRTDEAMALLGGLGEQPDFAPFYVARAQLTNLVREGDPIGDLRRAVALETEIRVLHVYLVQALHDQGRWNDSLVALGDARALFPMDFNLALLEARTLINLERGDIAAEILGDIHVLPSESARESHRFWEQAHTLVALDALEVGNTGKCIEHLRSALEWPESLGQGRPYEPEERLVRFLLAVASDRAGNSRAAQDAWEQILAAAALSEAPTRLDLFSVAALGAVRPTELSSILERDLGSTDPAKAVRRLAAAMAVGTQRLPTTIRSVAQEYPSLFDDLEGRLILRALTAGFAVQ